MISYHKIAALTATLTAALSFLASPVMAFSVGATNNTEILKNNLLGNNIAGLSDFSVLITGNQAAFGTFINDPFGLQSGVVLSTGKVTNIPGQNRKDNLMTNGSDLNTDFGVKGESGDLTQLDLRFFADDTAEKLFFEYVFGSEEFPEFGGSEYNDDFELLLNGRNLAKLSDGKTVTINNLVPDPNNRSTDHSDYINNPSLMGIAANIIKLDGFTKVLGFEGLLKQNQTNVLSIRMKDVGDGNFDSAVFIKGGSVGTIKADTIPKSVAVLIKDSSVETVEAEPVPEPMTVGGLMAGGAMLAAGRKLRRRK
ncbi:MAG: PEP-CTERM sorting domain-containing protein [Microcoleus sp. PH2017_40_RAT_O_B]|uniref:choice-of-anchor L family PEP-CTERM protein n=1 Tax=unclassified Microcoleus TaxID=2642155 RepID=UPI001D516C3A|nr:MULTISPECIES: choice-of-anchor L domain-containing protein [unclassified Microcoleus]MCC3467841.1 PEP-CTERM sorting domain-containing protein [Microcoleus sp. PH2017_06_SFM_O_A]TAF90124.1 MAG: PEP-CTERM sorting domain-containing protein [Oscillatoriales cyanobacterium]MCC3439628.1 PEP-CTERM sorting domain-containing protein [Microcoleus sp. PH2017_05_CCC_O_A]MCC3448813.1 PEP-CTERM sorting domain-containing protein [Microcoleus sp. PH2017_09_SFU_O_A]MCC3473333.1 PEP-CTERM sorting domain-cont